MRYHRPYRAVRQEFVIMASVEVRTARLKLNKVQQAKYELDRQVELKATGNGATPGVNERLLKSTYYQTWKTGTPDAA
jgi:hypothetical protein